MDYSSLSNILNKIHNNKIQITFIGKSVLGKNIYAVLAQNQNNLPWAIITGAIHAREHLSADLIVAFIHDYINSTVNFNVAFVPMVNPDGADIAINGIDYLPKMVQRKLKKINGSQNFCLYKANANGVDLNNNFNANWQNQFSKKNCPSSQGYYGKKPFSEPETQALRDFTLKLRPFITLSYHLKGEEIYFDFFQKDNNYNRDFQIAQVFANATGYTIKSTQNSSSGGYKDWCVQTLKIPALTIELGADNFVHPYPAAELSNMYTKNKGIFDCLNQALQIYNQEKTNGTHGISAKTCTKSI